MDKHIIITAGIGSVRELTAAKGYLLEHKTSGLRRVQVYTSHPENWKAVKQTTAAKKK